MSVVAEEKHADTRSSSYRWVIISVWMTGHVFGFIVLESLGLLLPSINKELHLSPIEVGLLGSAPRIGTMALAIPAGWLLSRYSPKKLTSVTFAIGTLLIVFQGWAPFFLLLLLSRFLFGITLVAREPARALLMRQWVRPREVVIVNSFANLLWGVTAIGFALTPVILKLLDDNWRHTLYVFALTSLGLALLWQVVGKERITPEYLAEMRSQEVNPITSILRYRELWIMGMGLMGIGITWASFATFWPTYMLENFDVSVSTSANLMAISGGISAVAGVGVGVLVSRVGKKRLILWLTGILLAGTQMGMLWTGSYMALVLIFLANGLAWTFFPITMTIPFELPRIKPRELAVAVTFMETAIWVGSFIGPLLTGALQQTTGDLRTALMVAFTSALSMSLAAMMLPRKWDQVIPETQPSGA
ncbi:MAG: MFS transporter [Dehalococcoidia bacterium]